MFSAGLFVLTHKSLLLFKPKDEPLSTHFSRIYWLILYAGFVPSELAMKRKPNPQLK